MNIQTLTYITTIMKIFILLVCVAAAYAATVPKHSSMLQKLKQELKSELKEEIENEIQQDLKKVNKKGGNDYIIGGTEAADGAYPWQVSLQNLASFHYCGGSYAGNGWVVTAAHCVDGSNPTSVYVLLGSNDNSDSDAPKIQGESIVVHPNWSPRGDGFPNDIALIKLESTPTESDNLQPVTLSANDDDFVDETCVISGWGDTLVGFPQDLPTQLMEAEMTVMSNSDCAGIWGGNSIDDYHVCVNSDTRGGCSGDSGGPLQCQKSDNSWTLVGATSWGLSTCDPSRYPTVYARVSYFCDWISETTDGEVSCS